MKRSERTQMYLDLAKISLAIENNQSSSNELAMSIQCYPDSPMIPKALEMYEKLKQVRFDLYEREADFMTTLCQRDSNAIVLGDLEVTAQGEVKVI